MAAVPLQQQDGRGQQLGPLTQLDQGVVGDGHRKQFGLPGVAGGLASLPLAFVESGGLFCLWPFTDVNLAGSAVDPLAAVVVALFATTLLAVPAHRRAVAPQVFVFPLSPPSRLAFFVRAVYSSAMRRGLRSISIDPKREKLGTRCVLFGHTGG
jgi:hypothetical protein